MSTAQTPLDAGAGLSLKRRHDTTGSLPVSKSEPSVASRALALSTYFLSGVLSINLSQFLGTPLKLIDEDWYNAWIAFTKQSFGLLTMTLTQAFAPTKVIVSGDASVRGQMRQAGDGTLVLDFPERLILIANHQIYTDWLYLWWIAYCNKMHGHLFIVLKESLKRIPILGWGMQLSQFIFLKRNWEQDKPQMAQAMQRLNKLAEPMWLLLFPEGTNLAPDTRQKSANWAKKNNTKDCQHVLLPRSTGLQFCLVELKDTVQYLYDCTVAYEGVPRGQYAQDIFTLKTGYLDGNPPKSVSMFWRRFAIKNIPVHDQKAFDLWLTARWREKDLLIENYHRFGRFPCDIGATKSPEGKLLRGCGRLEVPIKSSHWYDFLQIFAPMGVLAMVLYVFYGALPQKMWNSINSEALNTSTNNLKDMKDHAKGVKGSFDMDSFFDRTRQGETFRTIGIDLMKQLQSKEAKSIVNRASLVQRWLEDPQKFVSDNLQAELPQQKRDFFRELQLEEQKRRGIDPNKHEGTFWKDIETLRADRTAQAATAVSKPIALSKKALEAAQRQSDPIWNSSKGSGSFWNDLKNEENTRRGSIYTLTSGSTDTTSARTGQQATKTLGTRRPPQKLPATSRPKAPAVETVKATTPSVKGNEAAKLPAKGLVHQGTRYTPTKVNKAVNGKPKAKSAPKPGNNGNTLPKPTSGNVKTVSSPTTLRKAGSTVIQKSSIKSSTQKTTLATTK